MIESERVFMAVWDRLRSDATLTALLNAGAASVHRRVAPPKTATPFLVVSLISGVPLDTAVGGTRVWTSTLVGVKAYVMGLQGWSTLAQIADRTDGLLQGYATVVDGAELGKLRLVSDDEGMDPPDGGPIFPSRLLIYRTEAAAA